jgi:hypothetical protein
MPLPDEPPVISLPLMRDEFDAIHAASALTTKPLTRTRCAAGAAGEIVVCATDPKRYRLSDLPDQPVDGLPKAQFGLGDGVAAAVRTEYSSIGGTPSNRVMVDLKFKF